MAAVCDSTTGLYDFTYALSWSLECQVARLLSDVPLVAMGMLVFGVLPLFCVIKKASLPAVSLFVSTSIAFVAAILDLANICTAVSTTFVANGQVIRATEVLFALSITFRYLFYWLCVTEPSRRNLSSTATQSAYFSTPKRAREHHIASWTHWRLPGNLICPSLLVAIVTIMALQIVWRVVPRFHLYSNVYATDASLELLVSVLLLLKLLLNAVSFNSVDGMLIHTFSECVAPISGLLFSVGIAVGNLLCFAFTESTVGRLLQAVEVYIIVVFVMITAFLRHCDTLPSTTSSWREKLKDVAFTLPQPARGSAFRITPPLIETPRMSTVFGVQTQNKSSNLEVLRRSTRYSLNRMSSWLSILSRHHLRQDDEEVKLWNAEKGSTEPVHTGNIELHSSTRTWTRTSKEWPVPIRNAPPNHMTVGPTLDVTTAKSTFSPHDDQVMHTRADISHRTRAISLGDETGSTDTHISPDPTSIPGVKHAESIITPSEISPVYCLDGILSLADASDSRTSLDLLLKQRNQLDKSIEALKSFSTETPTKPPCSNPVLDDRSVELARSSSIGQRTVCSEVSLSSFPIPPWSTTPVPPLPPPSSSSIKRIRGDRRVRLAVVRPNPVQDACILVPPKSLASLVDLPGSPYPNSTPPTPTGEDNEHLCSETVKFCRSDSAGTQYNVTSFIGDLATPGGHGNQDKSCCPEDKTGGVIKTDSGTEKFASNILSVARQFDESRALTTSKLSPTAYSSKLDTINEPNVRTSRPLVNANSPCVENGSSRPRLVADPLTDVLADSKGDRGRVQKSFGRRRPPPLTIRSYAEHNADTSRVHVLVDD